MMRRSPLPSRSSVKLTVGAVDAVGACPLPVVMGASVSVQVRQVGHKLEARRGRIVWPNQPSPTDGGQPSAGGGSATWPKPTDLNLVGRAVTPKATAAWRGCGVASALPGDLPVARG